jgi:type VI secretion system Hcp family effector
VAIFRTTIPSVSVVKRIGSPGRAALLILVGAAGGGAALAVANVPDSTGVIHACYQVPDPGQTVPSPSAGNLRVIDPSAGQACDSDGTHGQNHSEQPLDWNAASLTGAPGAPGPSGALGAQGPPGNGLTITSPSVKSTAHPVGEVDLGTGRQALNFDILELSFASSSTEGGSAAKVSVHDISITKKVDKASPAFFRACVSGAHYKKVTITMRKAGGSSGSSGTPFLKMTMTDVHISSYQLVPSSGGGTTPQESATLHFAKIEF